MGGQKQMAARAVCLLKRTHMVCVNHGCHEYNVTSNLADRQSCSLPACIHVQQLRESQCIKVRSCFHRSQWGQRACWSQQWPLEWGSTMVAWLLFCMILVVTPNQWRWLHLHKLIQSELSFAIIQSYTQQDSQHQPFNSGTAHSLFPFEEWLNLWRLFLWRFCSSARAGIVLTC